MRRLLILVLTATVFGCSTVASVTRPIAGPIGEALLSPEEEKRLGDELAAQVRQEEQVLDDSQIQSYVDQIGQRLAQASGASLPYPFTFTVLDKPGEVNAFALPGGHIFIYSGLIQAADTEAELAAVLAHEVAHVTSGHVRDKLTAQVGTQALQQLALGKDPALLAQLASQIVATGYLAAYSRDAEQEADSRGLDYLAGAGYEPAAMSRFFQELDRLSGGDPGLVGRFLASHPAPGDRSERVRQLIQERGYGGGREAVVGGFKRIQAQVPG